MNRWLLALPILWFCTAPVMAAQTPIQSRAELSRYLQQTQAGASPLDSLSPGGRKRFLDQLKFGEHGLTGFSFDDPQNELTHPQVVQLFTLFGAEEYGEGRGVTPARHAQLQRERADDAATRGCAEQVCPESDIEQRYDELVLWKADKASTDADRAARIRRMYVRLFTVYQKTERLSSISSADLRLLKRAAEHVVSVLPDATYIAQLRIDLAEMQRRGIADDKDYQGLHHALVASRQFAAAEVLTHQHPGMDEPDIPALHHGAPLHAGWPTALTTSKQGLVMIREAFDLSTPLRIVVVASCHFSQDAARAIEADTQLRPLFARHAIWLASESESFDAVARWNGEFPQQPIHVAWQDSEWPMLDSWDMPTFYVFHDGHLTGKFSGWLGLESLKHSLHEAGALR